LQMDMEVEFRVGASFGVNRQVGGV
jgi:hypothetical protein